MLFGFTILGARYNREQLGGTLLILIGVAVAIVPDFTGNTSQPTKNVWYSVLIFAMNPLPTSLAYTLKEKYFKSHKIDVFWLTTMVSWSQLAITWVFVPLLALKYFGGTPLSDIPSVFRDGAKCFIGDSSIPVYDGDKIIGYCGAHVPLYTMLFSVTGFITGICSLYIVSHGSAMLNLIGSAIQLPLTNLSYCIPAFMGKDTESFSPTDLAALIWVLAGFLLYSLFPNESEPAEGNNDENQDECEGKCEETHDEENHQPLIN
eukprot:TRINITY_DN4247_c0_g1_i2.p1 TRINITY_DN4247_c0_g1~~TRINITY_DN4247_c0_g1_i2.p1  ORF type:complete len:262 (+),score=33.77 TRINITY_DN4247_c0_g1_i2:505-1290(+)